MQDIKKPKTKQEKPYQLLTPRQEKFCHEYLKDRNGMQAAIRANYSPRSAKEQASRLLTKDNVRYRVNQLIEEQFNRIKLSADLVIKGLLKISEADIRDAFDEDGNLKPIKDLPEPIAKAIAGVETDELYDGKGSDREKIGVTRKIKFWNKNEALRDLGRHLKMFTDVQEIRGLENLAEDIKQARVRAKYAGTTRRKSRD
jgi:phage terminase small subunit